MKKWIAFTIVMAIVFLLTWWASRNADWNDNEEEKERNDCERNVRKL